MTPAAHRKTSDSGDWTTASSNRLPPYLAAGGHDRVRPSATSPPLSSSPSPPHALVPETDRGGAEASAQSSTALRPFVLTRGRVGDDIRGLTLETQVTANSSAQAGVPDSSYLTPELQSIVALCAQPMSVAEISARLRLHLGVTKVLVSDLRAAGHLEVHICDPSNPHSPETIMRVIRALRAIS